MLPGNVISYELLNRINEESDFLWQGDYGQKMKLTGIDLPVAYTVHFANSSKGSSIPSIGDESGVMIPDQVLTSGRTVYFWLFLHPDANSGQTVYANMIKVHPRTALPTIDPPTPQEQSILDQLMAALEAGIAEVQTIVEGIPGIVDEEIEEKKEEFKGDPGAVFTPSIVNGVLIWTNDSGLPNPEPTDLRAALNLDTFATKQELNTKADAVLIGANNGIASLDETGHIPSAQLPSYVDDVLEFPSVSQFPNPGEKGKIYCSTSNNNLYRWTGTQYINISSGDISSKADKRDTVLETTLSRGRASNTTVGVASIAFGEGNEASGLASDAFGRYTVARGNGAFAEGSFTTAQGVGAHAEGHQTGATAEAAHAEGEYTGATSLYAHAEGYHTLASGNGAHAEGNLTEATEDYAHVEGYHSKAKEDYSHAEGYYTETTGNSSHAEGREAKASGQAAHAEGQSTLASGANSHAEGTGGTFTYNSTEYTSRASGTSSHSEGDKTVASGIGAHSEGHNTFASGEQAHSEGAYTIASAPQSHAEGSGTLASGTNAHAEGHNTIASGALSHAEGYGGSFQINGTTYTSGSLGTFSHSEGDVTVASGDGAHSEGFQTIATGSFSHAEGYGGSFTLFGTQYTAKAAGTADHTEGYKTATAANGNLGHHAEGYCTAATGGAAHSEGAYTLASGESTHSEGYGTKASDYCAHAEGSGTTASGVESHAENYGTIASGVASHAEGYGTTASGTDSHAEGFDTIAAGADSHVSGRHNIADSYANWTEWTQGEHCVPGDKRKRTRLINEQTVVEGFICKTENTDSDWTASHWTNQVGRMNYAEIVGNGTGYNEKSNARVLDWDGNGFYKGNLYVGCNANSTGGSKVVCEDDFATDEDTQAIITEYWGVS